MEATGGFEPPNRGFAGVIDSVYFGSINFHSREIISYKAL